MEVLSRTSERKKEPLSALQSPNRRLSRYTSNVLSHLWRSIVFCCCAIIIACLLASFFRIHKALHLHGLESALIHQQIVGDPSQASIETSKQQHVHNNNNSTTTLTNLTSPFAYAFVIGGGDPDNTPSYQNYLFNVLIATIILKHQGSTADVVALFQVSAKAKRTRLPHKDVRLLHALGVHVYYIPQQTAGQESFYRTQLDKFRILGLTQYQRILFMDGDVMPLANLDYLFELSVGGTLQENVVMQGFFEPANGGFFMLRPGYLKEINDIIQWRERTGKTLPYPHFDPLVGWGQPLPMDDPWVSKKQSGTNYTFLAAFADQGLLYYYTKYVRRSVSIVLRNGTVENWASVDTTLSNGTTLKSVQRQSVLHKPMEEAKQASNPLTVAGKHNRYCTPMSSFVHFTGRGKPWLKKCPKGLNNSTKLESAERYWFWNLMELDKELEIGLNFSTHWSTGRQRPSLGLWPNYRTVREAQSNLLTKLERDYPETEIF